MTYVAEVESSVYRISSYVPEMDLQFNQLLITDEEPFLMHTGLRSHFPATYEAVRSVLDPVKLRWIGVSHFEADECGSLNDWLSVAPRAAPVCGPIAAAVNLDDFSRVAPHVLHDGQLLKTGRKRLRYLATPHVPHGWDAGLFFEERDRTLLCSDLFLHRGDPEPLTNHDLVTRAEDSLRRQLGTAFGSDIPYTPETIPTLHRLAGLEPRTLATMHGSSFAGQGRQALLDLAHMFDRVLGARSRVA
jgi:flavorubredoxin